MNDKYLLVCESLKGIAVGTGIGGTGYGALAYLKFESELAKLRVQLKHATDPQDKKDIEEEIASMVAMGKKRWTMLHVAKGAAMGSVIGHIFSGK